MKDAGVNVEIKKYKMLKTMQHPSKKKLTKEDQRSSDENLG